jgi:hypothetical protein
MSSLPRPALVKGFAMPTVVIDDAPSVATGISPAATSFYREISTPDPLL